MFGLADWGSWMVFVAYIILFVNNSLLVSLTKDGDNGYNYSTVLVVLLIELTKLIMSVLFYFRNHSLTNLIGNLLSNKSAFAYYLVPSALYCIFNNLVFLNLAHLDPTTYTVLLQFSVVITGLLYQCIFKRNLNLLQWVSLVVLTLGCIMSHLNESKQFLFEVHVHDVFILVQVFCSSFAGVYNEYLLKNYNGVLDFWLQNVIMYTDSSICGMILMMITGNLNLGMLSSSNVKSVCQPIVIAIVCNNVTGGLVTSIFLHKLNSIVKKFAAAIEMVILAILSRVLLGMAIEFQTVVSVLIVSLSIIVYSLNPLEINKEVLNQN